MRHTKCFQSALKRKRPKVYLKRGRCPHCRGWERGRPGLSCCFSHPADAVYNELITEIGRRTSRQMDCGGFHEVRQSDGEKRSNCTELRGILPELWKTSTNTEGQKRKCALLAAKYVTSCHKRRKKTICSPSPFSQEYPPALTEASWDQVLKDIGQSLAPQNGTALHECDVSCQKFWILEHRSVSNVQH